MNSAPLPTLAMNRLLVVDLLSAEAPCFAMGYIEHAHGITGAFILRPDLDIPDGVTEKGFNFGHSLMSIGDSPLLHFAFEFYDHVTYSGLVNPANPLVQDVVKTMIDTGDYFFFAIDPQQKITAFSSEFNVNDMAGLGTNFTTLEIFDALGFASQCTPEQYETAATKYAKAPQPEGRFVSWVCRDNPEYLDMKRERIDLTPR